MKTHKSIPACLFLIITILFHCHAAFSGEGVFQPAEARIPVTHMAFQNNPDDFTFAVIADRTGNERPGIFEPAMAHLNLIRPEFVINIGDSIEGYVNERETIEAQWNEFDNRVNQLEMPFFRIVGNHDVNYPVTQDIWHQRYGMEYYYFLYKNILFLCLSTDDPPIAPTEEMINEYKYFQKALQEESEPEKKMKVVEAYAAFEKRSLPTKISTYQVDYFKKVISAHPDVRWTFVFLHKPAWENPPEDTGNFKKIEAFLENRPYTVFAGHEHSYRYMKKNGRDYIRLSTVGGGYPMLDRENTFDHITLVSMTDKGPAICNIRVDGILDKTGRPENKDEK